MNVPPFTVDYATGVEDSIADGVAELEVSDPDTEAVIQSTGEGVRVISSVLDADGPREFSYSVSVPDDAQLHEEGELVFIEGSEEVYGVLQSPWAVDAAGEPVETWYTWADGVLTQHLEISDDATYPVIADPAWTYTYSYLTNKTSTKVESLLRKCFNCYFPVSGAPRAFPAKGQKLPLKVGPANFECTMGGIGKVNGYLFQYAFAATKNHVDGKGSTIVFSFRSDKRLYVTGKVQSVWMNNWYYRGGAFATWNSFAQKLRNAK